jgi:hypothetical protein
MVKDWKYISEAELYRVICEVLGSIPSRKKRKEGREEERKKERKKVTPLVRGNAGV